MRLPTALRIWAAWSGVICPCAGPGSQVAKAEPTTATGTVQRRLISETEYDVGADRPPGDIRTPEIRAADSDPLNLPELVQEIQHHAAVDLVEARLVEATAEAAIETGPPVV